jgi:hypothetical protein
MKYTILSFLIIYSCKNEILVYNKIIQKKVPFYDIIFDELENIDTSKYYITYQIKKDFNITNEIFKSIENIELLNNKEKENLKENKVFKIFDIELSSNKKEIVDLSKKNSTKKIEINYQFSFPYLLNENKVLIINSIKYRDQISKDVKGGSERVIILTKNEGVWIITKKVILIDM